MDCKDTSYGFFCDMEHGYSYNLDNESYIKPRGNKQTRNLKFTRLPLIEYINEDHHINKELYNTDYVCNTYDCFMCKNEKSEIDDETIQTDKHEEKMNRELSRRIISVSVILGLSASIIICLM